MKLLKEYYIRLDTKWSATHCKGSLKNTFGATCGFQASKVFFLSFSLSFNFFYGKSNLKGSQIDWKSYAYKYHPNWVSSCHPFDDVCSIEVCFQSSTPSHMY